MVPILDPGNLVLLFFLYATMGIPLSVLTVILFFVIRLVPSRLAQCLIPLIAGVIVVVTALSMEPPTDNSEGIRFLIGLFIHPLLILPPIMIMQKYLNRIPVTYAVFFTALISVCVVLTLGALQGDIYILDYGNARIIRDSTITVIEDLLISSLVLGLIIGFDRMLIKSDEMNS
jgi:hypothetical protein